MTYDVEKMRELRRALKSYAQGKAENEGYDYPSLYDPWAPDTEYAANKVVMEEPYLYKCRQKHTSQEIYPPHLVPALWARIPKPGEGTHDLPIPYDANIGMELTEGLYYSEDDVLYQCFRSSGQPVYNRLADLVDIYVRVSNGGGADA